MKATSQIHLCSPQGYYIHEASHSENDWEKQIPEGGILGLRTIKLEAPARVVSLEKMEAISLPDGHLGGLSRGW